MVPHGIPISKRFLLNSAALFSNCKLRNPEEGDYLSVVITNSIKLVSLYGFLPNAIELERKI